MKSPLYLLLLATILTGCGFKTGDSSWTSDQTISRMPIEATPDSAIINILNSVFLVADNPDTSDPSNYSTSMEQTPETIAARYDAILYPGQTRSSAHPDRMATIGTLYGIDTAPLDNCSVLELGCGTGENLMSIAMGLPASRCVGVDIAARPVAIGNEMIAALGIGNLRLEQADVMAMPESLGTFDYIIAHGLFSWVPPEVQSAVLDVVRRHLAPNGIAFISYNAFPGWHMAMAAREVMQYHSRHFEDPAKQLEQARGILDFVAKSTLEVADAYLGGIRDTRKKVRNLNDGGLYHDDLAEVNIPLYFHQFASMIDEYELQFLGEADFIEMQDHLFPPDVAATIRKLAAGNVVVREQFLDFLKGRKFRQSLIVHRDLAIDRNIVPSRLTEMIVSSKCTPLPPDPEEPDVQRFELLSGGSFSSGHPAATAVLMTLSEHAPRPLGFDELLHAVWKNFPEEESAQAREESRAQLGDILLWTYTYDLIELRRYRPQFVDTISEQPVASPLARMQGTLKSGVTNILHQRVVLEGDVANRLLELLDGTRDRSALLRELRNAIGSGPESKSDEVLVKEFDEAMQVFRYHALLIA